MSLRWRILLESVLLFALSSPVSSATPAEQEFGRVMHLKPDAAHGRELFDTCAACHGSTGAGVSDGSVPAIAGQHFSVIARALIAYRADDRQDPRMRHFTNQHHLSGDQDTADVAAYVSRLLPALDVQHGDGLHLAQGNDIYARRCAACHGAKAQGKGDLGYPRLAGQHYDYLVYQMSSDRWQQIVNEHTRVAATLGHSDLLSVCDYLSRLRP